MNDWMTGDQAETLRRARAPRTSTKRDVTRVISFTSGKGGVGKTHTVLNTAIALAELGRSVLILDADLSLANIDVLIGIEPKRRIEEVIQGECDLADVIVQGPMGISIIPASTGVEALSTLDTFQRMNLLEAIERSALHYDYLLIDTAAGIGTDVMHFNSASSEVVCIVTDEPTSLTDAYALIKVLSRRYGEKEVSVLVNNVSGNSSDTAETVAHQTFQRLARSVERFLQVRLKFLGFVPSDPAVSEGIRRQKPLLEVFPSSSAARAILRLGKRIDQDFVDLKIKGGMQFFFQDLLELADK